MSRVKQITYGLMALAGLAATTYFNLQFMSGDGGGMAGFLADAFASPAASSFSVDLFSATLTFLVWSFLEARRLRMKGWWIYALATLLVAFAVSYPIFLLMRERKLAATLGEEGEDGPSTRSS